MRIRDLIIDIVSEHKEIRGTEHLAADLIGTGNHTHVRRILKSLEQQNEITIIRYPFGGRGHRNVIRVNKNRR